MKGRTCFQWACCLIICILSVFTVSSCEHDAMPKEKPGNNESGSNLDEGIKEYYYINKEGVPAFSERFNEIRTFSEGMAAVEVDGKWGFIDSSCSYVIAPTYSEVFDGFSEGLAPVRLAAETGQPGKIVYIDRNGDIVIELSLPNVAYAFSFHEGLAVVGSTEDWGFIDKEGRVVIEQRFGIAMPFSEGLAAVSIDGQMGFIDKAGAIAIEARYSQVSSFSEGLAPVETDGKFGYIDKAGNMVVSPQFNSAFSFSDGVARVTMDGLTGYIDTTGEFVIQPQFEYALDFSDGLAQIYKNNKYGYVDKEGNLVIRPQYKYAECFSDGLAGVADEIEAQ